MLPQGDAGDRDAWARSERVRLCLGELVLFLALRKMTRLFRMPETKKTLRFSFSSLDLPETTKTPKPVNTGLEGAEFRLWFFTSFHIIQ